MKELIWSETGMKQGVGYSYAQYMVKTDGGRSRYFNGSTGDCVTRAIAVATGMDYKTVYDELFQTAKDLKVKNPSPRNGVERKVYETYLTDGGWRWVPLMKIGSGCTVHFRGDELPSGRIICRLSRHVAAMIDGVVYDTYDSTRRGERCVYGYFYKP